MSPPAEGPDYAALLRELAAGPAPEAEPDPTDAKVLDATLRLASEYGEQRLTIDQVARQSRVARATIFRRFGSKDALIARMHERELRAALAALRKVEDLELDAAGALAEGASTLLGYARSHPLVQRIARAEPETLVALHREGDPSGISLLRAVFSRLVVGRPGADAVAPERWSEACDALARVMFADLMIPDSEAARRDDAGERTASLRRIIAGVLGD